MVTRTDEGARVTRRSMVLRASMIIASTLGFTDLVVMSGYTALASNGGQR